MKPVAPQAAPTPVSDLLRRLLDLPDNVAYRSIRAWAHLELRGYPRDAELPPYRPTLRTKVRGEFRSLPGGRLQRRAISPALVPEELDWLLEALFTLEIRQGADQLEQAVRTGEKTLALPWDAAFVSVLRDTGTEMSELVNACQLVPTRRLVAVLDHLNVAATRAARKFIPAHP